MNQSVSKINHVDVVTGSPAPFAAVKVMDSTAVGAAVTVAFAALDAVAVKCCCCCRCYCC